MNEGGIKTEQEISSSLSTFEIDLENIVVEIEPQSYFIEGTKLCWFFFLIKGHRKEHHKELNKKQI